MIRGKEALLPYLSGGLQLHRSLGCWVQVHISPRQNDVVRFLHLEEKEKREPDS